jgi:molecular chaperone GrpE
MNSDDPSTDEGVAEGAPGGAEAQPDAGPAAAAAKENPDRVAELESERDLLKEQVLRAFAETENVRKRANRQIADERLYAVEKFAKDLLSVSDNLTRALETAPEVARESESAKTLVEGVEMTLRELHAVLARHGVTVIDAAPGAAFDPSVHQAITQIPSEHAAGAIAQLFQSGWRISDRTLRPAMVAVSSGS